MCRIELKQQTKSPNLKNYTNQRETRVKNTTNENKPGKERPGNVQMLTHELNRAE